MAPPAASNGIPTGTASSKQDPSMFESIKNSIENFGTMKDALLHGLEGGPIDDKTYLMERIIELVSELPPNEKKSDTLTNSFLTQLWNDLEHPPNSYLGYDFSFRKADGSNNNVLWPHIGKAGMPYARSVRPRKMQRPRPDPGVIFDSILERKGFVEHPNKISSVLFYTASIIIHDCFHTSHEDYAISETSSYLDLSPLYGSSEDQQKSVRTFKDGKLKPDCFADNRILGFPPGVGVMLIMFNRFHNNVVENLKQIDEGGRFSNLLRPGFGRLSGLTDTKAKKTPEQDFDEALFQTGRLVTTGLYINIILQDYVRTILGLNRVDTLWNLDPRSDYGKAMFAKKIPEAQGNQVSAEFSLVYRWHSCVSKRDEAWTDAFLKENKLNAPGGSVLQAAKKWADDLKALAPEKRPFEKLERLADGSFPDDKLCEIWCDSVQDVAGAFGAAHVPSNLKFVEILSMMQARAWNLASLNEFREYFKLAPHKTFEDINPDPRIADQLKKLYGHPDNVEIYPGIVVESAKKSMSPGSGLCASFTTSRAILADAVALVRSDRFYTVDYTPNNLTNWGFNAASSDQNINHGGVFYKLVLNAFPNIISKNSVFAHFPLVVPDENKKLLAGMKRAELYDFKRPVARPAPLDVKASAGIASQALTDSSSFVSLWPQRSVAFGAPEAVKKNTPTKLSFADAIMANSKWKSVTEQFYSSTLQQLWQKNQYELGGWQTIDIVADVLNAAHAAYLTTVLGIPSSSDSDDDESHGLLCLFGYLHEHAHGANPQPQGLSTGVRKETHSLISRIGSFLFGGSDSSSKTGELGKAAIAKVKQANGISTEEAAWKDIVPTAALMATALCRSSARFVRNAIAEPDGSIKASTPAPEAGKLAGTTIAVRATTSGGDAEKDQKVNVSLSGATDVSAFGPEVVLTQQVAEIANKAILDIVNKTNGIRKMPGPQGTYKDVLVGGETKYLNEQLSDYVSYPVSMRVRWQVKK